MSERRRRSRRGSDEGQLHWLGGISARTMVSGRARPRGAEARLLEVISPAGVEACFDEIAAFFPVDASPDPEGLAEATARYGLEMDDASLPGLVERFGLARPPELDG